MATRTIFGGKVHLYKRPNSCFWQCATYLAGRIRREPNLHARDNRPHTGKPPSRSTLHDEIVTLRQVLKTAIRHGRLDRLPDLSPPYKTQGKISHRAWFSHKEYKQLYTATRKRARKPKHPAYQWHAEQLHDYVLFMANTGLRPDEAKNLQHRDVEIVTDEWSGEKILEIGVRGKRSVGYCMRTPGAVRPYERLRDRPKPVKDNGHAAPAEPVLPVPTDPVFAHCAAVCCGSASISRTL